ncbi:MAG: glycerol-3-phosphate acyltransferase [Chloroflexi bacterium]|nr:glycerol-3-phosphate acyltransferase [Chloroflexota bacterium]MCI0810817.1 glycerol-3-phosphate acyltransferase [Chloroflexota bacterium]MCI0829867.1 glycerol-3-phosphate acyltransferase [Chloroflexota bacterium]MCI0848960.1 glycerol-3-phosphate acyltransferase [Chloroflexota bacterium]MCI0898656.1 glycerol-3-phosphate acyltransferase [Chloroflexota bacterium]
MILELFTVISLALGAYILGSVPTAYILVRSVKGEDIRDVGSRNVGALNVYRQVGAGAGLAVLLVDTAKGVVAVAGPRLMGLDDWVLFITTPLVVAGHNWPVFLNFRGGKGAAAIFGISLVIVPWLTVITAGPSILVMLLLRNVVLGAALGFILLNILLWVTGQGAQQVGLCLLLTALVTGTYMLNVREHIFSSIKARQWRQLFSDLAG